jgi:hypothetical protein
MAVSAPIAREPGSVGSVRIEQASEFPRKGHILLRGMAGHGLS